MLEILIGFSLAAIGIGFIIYLFGLFLSPLFSSSSTRHLTSFFFERAFFFIAEPRLFLRQRRFKLLERALQKQEAVSGFKNLSREQRLAKIGELKNLFFLENVWGDSLAADQIYSHNLLVLDLLVGIATDLKLKIESLSVLDGLLLSRTELLKRLNDARLKTGRFDRLFDRFFSSRREWATREFRQKSKEIEGRLEANLRAFKEELEKATVGLSAGERNRGFSSEEESIIVH
ncbi:MAG TPA: hypothetical protein PKD37_02800 [Oligoflexia bacterium]|nr:hypothetical protein [Oligoflexia bacterium]HMP26895.1 hypothetical protein [Oligoflexia bacterium]